MVPRRGRPIQSWKTFLRNHADGIASVDLFVVPPTVTFERLFAFVVLGHGRRTLLWFAVTTHPGRVARAPDHRGFPLGNGTAVPSLWHSCASPGAAPSSVRMNGRAT
jgi:hypothetical protein